MITGESGCGKELVAGAIHKFSPRAQKEFVAINVTAIPDNLLESEIFGHEKGSFTGAVNQRVGRFEQCDGGTLFLDEIGDMPLAVQSKLLRVLQEGQYSRVGSNQTLKTDVRVLAATNKNLEEEVAKGTVPRRPCSTASTSCAFTSRRCVSAAKTCACSPSSSSTASPPAGAAPQMRFTDDALDILDAYDWPGNVRELENTIQRACALCNSDVLLPSDIPSAAKACAIIGPVQHRHPHARRLSMLVSVAEKTPDIELLPWVERERARVLRPPAWQCTRVGFVLSSLASWASKSSLRMSMFRAPSIWPSTNSSEVRTSMIIALPSAMILAAPSASTC
jgi:two-component system nitrogen regulation response regulator GlnG